eukprot:213437-Pelagomonas_calceolata.AAC.1
MLRAGRLPSAPILALGGEEGVCGKYGAAMQKRPNLSMLDASKHLTQEWEHLFRALQNQC